MRRAAPARAARPDAPDQGAPSDEDLVAAAIRDRHAFALLYDRYLDAVYRYCYRCLGTREAAEDATADVFVRALAALPRYRAGAFRSWLFAIAHNVIATAAGRRRPAVELADAEEVPDPAPSPESAALAAAERSAVHDLLARLPANQRHLIELRLAGLTDAEIACALGRSHVAVRVAQHRAVGRLRTLLGGADGEGPRG